MKNYIENQLKGISEARNIPKEGRIKYTFT